MKSSKRGRRGGTGAGTGTETGGGTGPGTGGGAGAGGGATETGETGAAETTGTGGRGGTGSSKSPESGCSRSSPTPTAPENTKIPGKFFHRYHDVVHLSVLVRAHQPTQPRSQLLRRVIDLCLLDPIHRQ